MCDWAWLALAVSFGAAIGLGWAAWGYAHTLGAERKVWSRERDRYQDLLRTERLAFQRTLDMEREAFLRREDMRREGTGG